MLSRHIDTAFQSIRTFLLRLGYSEEHLLSCDKSQEVLLRDEAFNGASLSNLRFQDWQLFCDTFRAPNNKVRLAITDVDSIDQSTPLTENTFDEFVTQCREGPCLVEIVIDKRSLLTSWGVSNTGSKTVFYFYGSAFETLVERSLVRPVEFEQALFNGRDNRLRVVLRDKAVHYEGPLLQIVGGHFVDQLIDNLTPAAVVQASSFYEQGRDRCRWEWDGAPGFLTPLHVRFSALHGESDSLCSRLLALWSNILLLYLARVAREDHALVVAIVSSARRECSIRLCANSSSEVVSDIAHVRALSTAVESSYGDVWGKDRLRMLQAIIARSVASQRQPVSVVSVTSQAIKIEQDLDWKWAAFINNRVDEFADDASEFEKEVSDTVKSFDEEVGELIKTLSATVVAAIGVAVAAVFAAVTKNSVSTDIIRALLYVYAAYLIVIPGLVTLCLHVFRFRAIHALFDHRRERFGRLLTETHVTSIVGSHVRWARWRFWGGFIANCVTLLAVIIACFVLADYVPDLREP